MSKRFDYVKFDDASTKKCEGFKTAMSAIEHCIEKELKPGRAKSLALTGLEESFMWVGKAIRDEQVSKNESVHVPERNDS